MKKKSIESSSQLYDQISLEYLFDADSVFLDRDQDGYIDTIDLSLVIDPKITSGSIWSAVLNLCAVLSLKSLILPENLISNAEQIQQDKNVIHVLSPVSSVSESSYSPQAYIIRNRPQHIEIGGSSIELIASLLNILACNSKNSSVSGSDKWNKITVKNKDFEYYLDLKNDDFHLSQKIRTLPQFQENKSTERDKPNHGNHGIANLNVVYRTNSDNPRDRILDAALEIPGLISNQMFSRELAKCVCELMLNATDFLYPLVKSEKFEAGNRPVIQFIETQGGDCEIVENFDPQKSHQRIMIRSDADSLSRLVSEWISLRDPLLNSQTIDTDWFHLPAKSFDELLNGRDYWGKWCHYLLHDGKSYQAQLPHITAKQKSKFNRALKALDGSIEIPIINAKTIDEELSWKSETEILIDLVRSIPEGQGSINGIAFISKPETIRKQTQNQLIDILHDKGYQPSLSIYNAYKPGLSWILEYVVPTLRQFGNIDSLLIEYRKFAESTKALELPSRWFQELFPGIEILEKSLGINIEKITNQEIDVLDSIYQITAFDENNNIIWRDTLTPRTTSLPYMNNPANNAIVYPSTGSILLQTEEQVILEQNISTDRERFWNHYQKEWLPQLMCFMEKMVHEFGITQRRVFWESIEFEIAIDESEFSLDIDRERVAAMEALQEDLYFNLLDGYAIIAERYQLSETILFGRIVPKIHSKTPTGQPYAKLRAVSAPWVNPPKIENSQSRDYHVVALGWNEKEWRIKFQSLIGFDDSKQISFQKIAHAWGFSMEWQEGIAILKIPKQKQETPKKQSITPLSSVPYDRFLSYEEVINKTKELRDHPRINTYTVARSWQDRKIVVIELNGVITEKRFSLARLRKLKPTILFNSRHHANEISATNASFELIRQLIETDQGKHILRSVNVVIMPMENVDGAALLEEINPIAPNYMSHVARYNALGLEFGRDYYKSDPFCPDATAKTRLWHRWLPELIIDQHGVPDHEWCQPFGGYAPYRFRNFWLPISFAFLYAPHITDPSHTNYCYTTEIVKQLNEVMKNAKSITKLNQNFSSRYNRYAHEPAPQIYSKSTGEPVFAIPLSPRSQSTNTAIRFPDVTKCEIVIEVPDEIASGEQLALCIKANRIIQDTVLAFLCKRQSK